MARAHNSFGRLATFETAFGGLDGQSKGEMTMATYIVLAHFTDQGIRNIQDTQKRAEAFAAMAKKVGANVKQLYWTLGRYDVVTVVEAPDVETITAVGLSTGKLGNVRTETLHAFDKAEMAAILAKVS
jgi:uncharacterized protein with GYD domain